MTSAGFCRISDDRMSVTSEVSLSLFFCNLDSVSAHHLRDAVRRSHTAAKDTFMGIPIWYLNNTAPRGVFRHALGVERQQVVLG